LGVVGGGGGVGVVSRKWLYEKKKTVLQLIDILNFEFLIVDSYWYASDVLGCCLSVSVSVPYELISISSS
jgi:hypothetical protein